MVPCGVPPDRRLAIILDIPPKAELTDDWPVAGSADAVGKLLVCAGELRRPNSLGRRGLGAPDESVCCGSGRSSEEETRVGWLVDLTRCARAEEGRLDDGLGAWLDSEDR